MGVAGDFDPYVGPKPLAVFIQTDPWSMVLGSDTPRIAIYDNGDVIFVKQVKKRLVYHSVVLDKEALDSVVARLKPVLAVNGIKRWYNIRPNISDQPQARLYLHEGAAEVATSVYGLMCTGTDLPGYTEGPRSFDPTLPPIELLTLHQWLCQLDFPSSKEWSSKYVEVMFWDYSYAPEASILWPAHWPTLDSDRAIQRGETYSIFLDGSMLPELQRFLASRKEKGAVEIGGKKMAVSYRFTFPGEPVWRRKLVRVVDPE
jgi:hypothetical protein